METGWRTLPGYGCKLPDRCPDGHTWLTGKTSMSYSKAGTYSHYCWPVPPNQNGGRPCRWVWRERHDGTPSGWQQLP